MITILGLDHIVLRTANVAAMVRFYCVTLGCTLERELPPEQGLVQLRAGDALIDLVAVDSELGRAGGGAPTKLDNNMDHFCLQISAVSELELIKHLKAQNVNCGEFRNRYGAQGFGRSLYISDPDSNTVELRIRQ